MPRLPHGNMNLYSSTSRARRFPSPRRCGKPSWSWRSRPTTLSFLTPSRFYHLVNDDAAAPHPLVALCPALREAQPEWRSSGEPSSNSHLSQTSCAVGRGERMIRCGARSLLGGCSSQICFAAVSIYDCAFHTPLAMIAHCTVRDRYTRESVHTPLPETIPCPSSIKISNLPNSLLDTVSIPSFMPAPPPWGARAPRPPDSRFTAS